MTNQSPDTRIATALAKTTRLQSEAADPGASVWVSANAGTGKTHVLTQRVLRLLLSGTAPERILCLTYTKAAAAEMSKRVFDTLSGWVGLDDNALTSALAALLSRAPSASERQLARTLFTCAIETAGGFKVQTIHAFCERLLQRFPLEAGIAPGFQILDDHTGRTLIREAIDATLTEATTDRSAPLGRALTTAIRYAADDHFDAVLGEAISKRALLESLARSQFRYPAGDPFATAGEVLSRAFGVRPGANAAKLAAAMEQVLDLATLARLRDALSGGLKTDVTAAEKLSAALSSTGCQRRENLEDYFLTADGSPRKNLMTKAILKAHPDLETQATGAQARFLALRTELSGFDAVAATLALYRLAGTVLQRYERAKAARAALDFEDLIVKTGNLLNQRDGAAWVLYKLDGGLDHILVDEAQDTSPAQWVVIEAIAAEFFNDTGAGARTETRTVFAVGDEKQSIYSFQGAAPEMFALKGAHFAQRAAAIGMPWQQTALTLSFRSSAPVLAAVDHIFADPAATPGLMTTGLAKIKHEVKRIGQAGLVELWPTELPETVEETGAWSPLDEQTPSSPVTRLAARIAATIGGWLDNGEKLASENRPIREGDILILVRKRAPFAPAIVAALKQAHIKVAGADRIELLNQIGVQDLLVLGDFLTLPEDDLALAAILKCPLFGLDDNDLLTLCHQRKGTLWKALLDAGTAPGKFNAARERLKRWRKDADFMPPFEFYAEVLDSDGGRAALINRLGPDAADGINAFLNLALTYDDNAPPSLTGFLSAVRDTGRTIKRDMEQGRNEVRVLTVHGAKGLEAPIVFLPDTCTVKSGRTPSGLLALEGLDLPSATPDLVVWPVKGSSSLPPIAQAKASLAAREKEELNRLLYVALTRPRDRLYVAGFQTRDTLPPGCWYDTIDRALTPHLHTMTLADGRIVRRLETAQTATSDSNGTRPASDESAAPLPAWISQRAPREAQPALPLAPSRLAPYDFDAEGEPLAHPPQPAPARPSEPVASPPAPGGTDRFLRGTLTHALLQYLPDLPPASWPAAARGFIDRRGDALPARVRQSIVTETLAVLCDPAFAPLFGVGSLPEVPIVAELANPKGKGPPLKLTGQIDRLIETAHDCLIVDYKSNRPPPTSLAEVPHAYIAQLAAYRIALAAIFPGKTVRAALLWTEIPQLMEIPALALDDALATLWDYGTAKLDAKGLPS